MPGISILFKSETLSSRDLDIGFLQYEPHYENRTVYNDKHFMFVYTGYPGYPLEIVDTETSLICIEGLIYNKSRETIAEEISHIERSFRDDLSCKETIRRFIQKSHGAYIVTVFLKDRQRLLLFADAWSRLKAYYYHDPKQLILSREHLFILNKIPEIRIDKMALSEFIILQYTLDHKTLLNDVNKTSTGFLLSAELRENSIHKMQDSLFSADFSTEKNVSAPQVCIEQSVALFLESIADIKNKLEELHYPITADLSGGYDSRAIFFGLNKMKVRADYYSDRLITGDESGVARKVADLCGQKISVIEASHTLDLDDLLRITYITGSNVNAITALVGYQDARARKKVCKEKSVKVGGFGGEYIRHPYHKVLGYVSIASMLKDEIFIRGLNVRHTAGLLKTNINTLIGNFRHYLERYEEKTVSDKIKHFYFDYYNNLVNLGEDRSRIHFWTVQPFMENTLLSYFIRAIPARYTSKKFFISFMAALDKRSLKAPIYGSKINLESRRSVNDHAFRERLDRIIRNTLIFKKISKYAKLFLARKKNIPPGNDETLRRIYAFISDSAWIKHYIDIDYLNDLLNNVKINRVYNLKPLFTVLLYMKEVENRHPEKIKNDE